MRFTISGKNIDVTESMRRSVMEKLGKLEPTGEQRLQELIADYKSVVRGVLLIVGEENEQ